VRYINVISYPIFFTLTSSNESNLVKYTYISSFHTAVESMQVLSSPPSLIIADSIQTIRTESCTSSIGSVAQIRESASKLVSLAKSTGESTFIDDLNLKVSCVSHGFPRASNFRPVTNFLLFALPFLRLGCAFGGTCYQDWRGGRSPCAGAHGRCRPVSGGQRAGGAQTAKGHQEQVSNIVSPCSHYHKLQYPPNTASSYQPNTASSYQPNTASSYLPNTASSYQPLEEYVVTPLPIANRFGSTSEIGVLAMTPSGLTDVLNPSELFLSGPVLSEGVEGSAVAVVMEGSR